MEAPRYIHLMCFLFCFPCRSRRRFDSVEGCSHHGTHVGGNWSSIVAASRSGTPSKAISGSGTTCQGVRFPNEPPRNLVPAEGKIWQVATATITSKGFVNAQLEPDSTFGGRKVYWSSSCYSCHGQDGPSSTAPIPLFARRRPLSHACLRWKTTDCAGPEPYCNWSDHSGAASLAA
jgi:cytochrome c553